MRATLIGAAGALLVGGPTALAFFSGGFFDRPRIVAGLVAWALVVLAALLIARPLPSRLPGRLALGGLALLVGWTALSFTWAPLAGRVEDDLQRLLLYLGFFAAATALLRGPRARRWLEPSLVLGALVVVSYGLSERLLPGLVELDRSFAAAGRLEQPLTYWNAFGILAALGFVLAARIAGDPDRPGPLRGSAAAAGVVLGLGAYLTFGRGALAAVAAGLLVLFALAPDGRSQLLSVVVITGAVGLAALLASRYPTVKTLVEGETGDAAAGAWTLIGTLALALAAAALVMREKRWSRKLPALGISRPAAVLTAAGLVLLAGALATAVFEGKPEAVSPTQRADPSRLGSIDTNRYRYWDVALESWADQPLHGIGSGGFQVEWLKQRDRVDTSGDAHSLYLETAAELGLVGLALLALFLGGVAAALVRLYRVDPRAAVGLAAGLVAWAVHAGLDWDWEMPAVTLPALLLAAAAVAWSEQAEADLEHGAEFRGTRAARAARVIC
jgi:O-Antigen ligase